jgi:hypothetical protein
MAITDFSRCTHTGFGFDGELVVSCKLGLWSVSGKDRLVVMGHASYYFKQYKEDGEYYNIIGGESPINKLTKGK